MKLFAVAYGAVKREHTQSIQHSSVGATIRKNEDEAIGAWIKIAKKEFPPSEGYDSHYAVVVEISQQWFTFTDEMKEWYKNRENDK